MAHYGRPDITLRRLDAWEKEELLPLLEVMSLERAEVTWTATSAKESRYSEALEAYKRVVPHYDFMDRGVVRLLSEQQFNPDMDEIIDLIHDKADQEGFQNPANWSEDWTWFGFGAEARPDRSQPHFEGYDPEVIRRRSA